MKRPSKKDIKAAIDALKQDHQGQANEAQGNKGDGGHLPSQKSSKRIRKQGI